jgi:hypothetical protein
VQGAQRWIGKARAHFGSYYLWGDVGQVGRRVVAGSLNHSSGIAPVRASKVPGFRFDGSGGSLKTASVKIAGQNWSRTTSGKGRNPDGRKVRGDWFGPYEEMKAAGTISPGRLHGKNSAKRKAASAEIAKIPFPLAQYIARCFKPQEIALCKA